MNKKTTNEYVVRAVVYANCAQKYSTIFLIPLTDVELRSCRPTMYIEDLKISKNMKRTTEVFTLKPFVKKKVEHCILSCSFLILKYGTIF